jgi:hypothetical protein
VQFLRQAQGYVVTDVKRESVGDGRCRVRDYWTGHRGFEIFRERFSEDFGQFEWQIAGELVEKEEFVGAYYEADGDDFVSA